MSEEKTKQFQYFPGHMKKSLNNLEKELKFCNGAIIVLDSRAPNSSMPNNLMTLLKKQNVNNVFFVYSKKDLVDTEKFNLFLKSNPDISKYKNYLINLNDKSQTKGLIKELESIKGNQDDKYLKYNFPLPSLDFVVLGIPNVGKSTLINNLIKRNVAQVENRPGKTRVNTLYKVSNRINLIDTPGILEPNYQSKEIIKKLALLGCVNLQALPFDELIEFLINYLYFNHYKEVCAKYSLDSFENNLELIEKIGRSKLIFEKGNKVNQEKVKMLLFKDFQNSLLGKVFLD